MTCGRRADDVRVLPGVVLHQIRELRQVFAWVSAINLTSKYRRSGKLDKRKPYWRCQKRGKITATRNIKYLVKFKEFLHQYQVGGYSRMSSTRRPRVVCASSAHRLHKLYFKFQIQIRSRCHPRIVRALSARCLRVVRAPSQASRMLYLSLIMSFFQLGSF